MRVSDEPTQVCLAQHRFDRLDVGAFRKPDALGGAPASLRLITQKGSPVRALVDHSRLSYLLVVGSRGHGRVAGLVLGSVSARCVEQANCPVLVVHDSEPPDTAPA